MPGEDEREIERGRLEVEQDRERMKDLTGSTIE